MKKPLLSALTLVLAFSMGAAHADWDAAGEAREAAARKAEKQRAAQQKASHAKMMRERTIAVYRQELGKDAVGKPDAEVERIYKQRQDDMLKQAAATNATIAKSGVNSKKGANMSEVEQNDALMKAFSGKSMSDLGAMSPKEAEAFAKSMEKKYGK
jgi:hypothetical protein